MSQWTMYRSFTYILILGVIYCSTHASGDSAVEDLSLAQAMVYQQLTGKSDESEIPTESAPNSKWNIYCDLPTNVYFLRETVRGQLVKMG